VSCWHYKKGMSDWYYKKGISVSEAKYSSLRVESSELASRVSRDFAAGIQQPL